MSLHRSFHRQLLPAPCDAHSALIAKHDALVEANAKLLKRAVDAEYLVEELSAERERLLARIAVAERLTEDQRTRAMVCVTPSYSGPPFSVHILPCKIAHAFK